MGLFWKRASLILYKIYSTIKRRSIKNLNHQIVKSSDEARIKLIEEGRDNLQWFTQNVPDECLIDLANKRYCHA